MFGITYSTITNVSTLELVHQERTNSSIAWKTEIHNSCLANISTEQLNSEMLGLGIANSCNGFFEFAKERVLFDGFIMTGIF